MKLRGVAESRVFRLSAAITGILIPALWLSTLVGPGEEAVKVRNALVARLGSAVDFDWAPPNWPASFLANRGSIPASFKAIASEMHRSSGASSSHQFEQAISISRHLMTAPMQVNGAIQSDNAAAYRAITQEGRGYCRDYTQVFNGIALAMNLPVREWSLSFNEFGAGHAFNEVYDSARGKWILIDSYHSLYFADPSTGQPLSVREVHDRLLAIGEPRDVTIVRIVPTRFPFRTESLAVDYYRRGMSQLGLIAGNNVFDYEAVAPVRWASYVSRALQQAIAIVIGVQPRLLIYPVGVSERDLRELFRLRSRFVMALACFAVAVLIFGTQIAGLIVRRSKDRLDGDVGTGRDWA